MFVESKLFVSALNSQFSGKLKFLQHVDGSLAYEAATSRCFISVKSYYNWFS